VTPTGRSLDAYRAAPIDHAYFGRRVGDNKLWFGDRFAHQ
jgi:hypothetical protein